MKASIVVGLGFGDEGKGITTDYLCSQSLSPIVVRFSGGQQAGHTVMLGDKKHVHSNFGSGTLRGVGSYFSEHCCIYLNTMAEERRVLLEKGITPKLTVHPFTRLTTPYDVAYNRMKEKLNQHGSCGLGIAATFKRHNETGYKLHAIDLKYPDILRAKLKNIKSYYLNKSDVSFLTHAKHAFLTESALQEEQFELALQAEPMFQTRGYSCLTGYSDIIFEGSQGIMLDMDHGIFPNVTYGNVTSKNAIEIMHKVHTAHKKADVEIYYATRCYQTRHGNGWMSSEKPIELINNQEEINVFNKWQTDFRVGELDYDLLNYALEVDQVYTKRYPKNIVVTCRDQRPDMAFDIGRLKLQPKRFISSYSPYSKDMVCS